MILGIGFIATITATVSAYFLSNFGEKQTTLDDVLIKLEKIENEIEKIKEEKMNEALSKLADDFFKNTLNSSPTSAIMRG